MRLMVDRRGHVYCRTQSDRVRWPATRCYQSTIALVRGHHDGGKQADGKRAGSMPVIPST